MNQKFLFAFIFVAVGLLSVQWFLPSKNEVTSLRHFSEKINLALRQTGHQLLALQGDDTSTIPPVQQKSDNEFILQLQSTFKYDTLPYLLDAAFEMYGISSGYQVAIKNCENDTLVLGYNLASFENNEVACLGREQWADCNNISVVFENETENKFQGTMIIVGLGVLAALLLFYLFFEKNRNTKPAEKNIGEIYSPIKIGASLFDYNNQTITVGGQQKELTFRENKLLHYFTSHPNEVLERENILSEVWGDEGVIVGRSLDVFVSRLRKILKDDESLKIKNVHGVGYRLEVLK